MQGLNCQPDNLFSPACFSNFWCYWNLLDHEWTPRKLAHELIKIGVKILGSKDHSIESVLEAVGKLNADRGVRINTVSFDCNDK